MHKKRLIIIIIFFLIFSNSFAQTFETYISTITDDVAHDAIALDNSDFLILSQRNSSDFSIKDYSIVLYELNQSGILVDSLYINCDTLYMLNYTRYFFRYGSNQIVIVGNCLNKETEDYQVYLAFIDTSMNLISDTIIGDTTKSDFIVDFLINENNCIVGTGFCYNASDKNIVFFDYNPISSAYRRVDYNFNNSVSTSTIIEIPSINAYHSFKLYNGEEIIQINRDSLSIDTIYRLLPPNTDSFIPTKAVTIPECNDYIISGRTADTNNNYLNKISIRKYNFQGEQLYERLYGVVDTNYYFNYNEVDCLDSTYLYLGGTHNFSQQPPFLFPERRWIFVNKIKLDGTIIWQHFYKGGVNYMPYKILATEDGGALILSHMYDWNSPYPNQRDIHILRVDSNGYYSGITSIDDITGMPLQILVYPNPASSNINIASGNYYNLEFAIYDLKGHLFLQKELIGSLHKINIERLPPDLYIYKVWNDNGFSESGKLIVR